MIFSRPVLAATVAALLTVSAFGATRAKPTRPASPDSATAYKGAIILDAATGNVLYEDRADVVSPPASMTKLMTFAVLHDLIAQGRIKLDTPVTVTAADSKIGGTQVWLKEKEIFPVEELLYAMMIQSANDAAHALARTAAGSVDAFVEMMNAKAQELGMTHTTFRTPHGLPPATRRVAEGDLTTPRDFALLCRHLVYQTDVIKYTSVKTRNFGPPVRATAVVMNNHDHLLNHIDGVDGLKTGFTNGAGFCLSTTALRHGRRVIVVVMGSPDSKTRDLKVSELVERGFAALPVGGAPFAASASASSPTTTSAAAPTATPPTDSPVSAAPKSAAPKAATGSGINFSIPPAKKKS